MPKMVFFGDRMREKIWKKIFGNFNTGVLTSLIPRALLKNLALEVSTGLIGPTKQFDKNRVVGFVVG